MELNKRVSKNLSLEIKESVVQGTSGVVIYTRTGDNKNLTVKVPDQITTIAIEDLELAIAEAKAFITGSPALRTSVEEPKVNNVVNVVHAIGSINESTKIHPALGDVPLEIIPHMEVEYVTEGNSDPAFNGN